MAPKPGQSFVRDDAPHKGIQHLPDRGRYSRLKSARRSRFDEVARDGREERSYRRDRVLSSTSATAAVSQRVSLKTADATYEKVQPAKPPQTRHWEPMEEFFSPTQAVSFASPISVSSMKGKNATNSSATMSHEAKQKTDLKNTFTNSHLSTSFTSPPLLAGIVQSLHEMLGADAKPTAIQSLSIKYILSSHGPNRAEKWNQFLLASETGSGKSIAYLLPMLQGIKQAELKSIELPRAYNTQQCHAPRGLVLAPTHELARQLSSFAKSLVHNVKLRVMCASQANVKNKNKSRKERKDVSSRTMAMVLGEVERTRDRAEDEDATQAMIGEECHPVDVMVGTPMKFLEMLRGRGWDREESAEEIDEQDDYHDSQELRKRRRGRDFLPNALSDKKRGSPSLDLSNVEWVVVDEADVLLGTFLL